MLIIGFTGFTKWNENEIRRDQTGYRYEVKTNTERVGREEKGTGYRRLKSQFTELSYRPNYISKNIRTLLTLQDAMYSMKDMVMRAIMTHPLQTNDAIGNAQMIRFDSSFQSRVLLGNERAQDITLEIKKNLSR